MAGRQTSIWQLRRMGSEGSVTELMQAHVEVLFTLDGRGRMRSANESGGGAAPRFFLGQTSEGNQHWFRDDLEDDMVRQLESLCEREPIRTDLHGPPANSGRYEALLAEHSPIESVWAGPAYYVAEEIEAPETTVLISEDDRDLLSPFLEDWFDDVSDCQPFAVALQDGRAVSLCATVRTTAKADEAGVDTHPDFRGHGFAGQVVATWAEAVHQLGRVPLYSTSWQNTASQAVARKLGLVQFGTDLHIR